MPCLPAVGCFLLQTCVLVWVCRAAGIGCMGQLSPPQNVSVDLLDFQAEVRWQPDRRNPPDTRYTVEIKECGCQWTPVKHCTLTSSKLCHIAFPLDLNELMKCYFLQVNAVCNGNSSAQPYLNSFQPYGNSVLSGPDLKVFVQNNSIYVHTRHHLEPVLSNFTYSINLTERTPDQDILVGTVSEAASSWVFPGSSLSPGEYCVSSSVNHRQQQRYHHRVEQCVSLPGHPIGAVKVVLLLVTLIMVPVGVVIFILYLKTRCADSSLPRVLQEAVKEDATAVLPMEMLAQLLHPCISTVSVQSSFLPNNALLQHEKPGLSRGYVPRRALFKTDCTCRSSPPLAEPTENTYMPTQNSNCPYKDAQDVEGGWQLQEQAYVRESTLWELDDGNLQVADHDVALSSLALGFEAQGGHMTEKSCQNTESRSDGSEPSINKSVVSEYHASPTAAPPDPLQAWPSEYEPREPILPASHMEGFRDSEAVLAGHSQVEHFVV